MFRGSGVHSSDTLNKNDGERSEKHLLDSLPPVDQRSEAEVIPPSPQANAAHQGRHFLFRGSGVHPSDTLNKNDGERSEKHLLESLPPVDQRSEAEVIPPSPQANAAHHGRHFLFRGSGVRSSDTLNKNDGERSEKLDNTKIIATFNVPKC